MGSGARLGPRRTCHCPCPRVDEFTHSRSTHTARSNRTRRTVAQRRAWPLAGNSGPGEKPPIARCNLFGDCTTRPLKELVASPETFVTTGSREPDLAEEPDRADEAAEAEVDEGIPSPAQQRQLLRAPVNLDHPRIGELCRALRNGRCRRGIVRWKKRHFHCPECDARSMPRTRPAAALPKCYRFNQGLRHRHGGSKKPARSRKPSTNLARHLSRDTFPPGSTQAGHDSRRNHYHNDDSGSSNTMQWMF